MTSTSMRTFCLGKWMKLFPGAWFGLPRRGVEFLEQRAGLRLGDSDRFARELAGGTDVVAVVVRIEDVRDRLVRHIPNRRGHEVTRAAGSRALGRCRESAAPRACAIRSSTPTPIGEA